MIFSQSFNLSCCSLGTCTIFWTQFPFSFALPIIPKYGSVWLWIFYLDSTQNKIVHCISVYTTMISINLSKENLEFGTIICNQSKYWQQHASNFLPRLPIILFLHPTKVIEIIIYFHTNQMKVWPIEILKNEQCIAMCWVPVDLLFEAFWFLRPIFKHYQLQTSTIIFPLICVFSPTNDTSLHTMWFIWILARFLTKFYTVDRPWHKALKVCLQTWSEICLPIGSRGDWSMGCFSDCKCVTLAWCWTVIIHHKLRNWTH